jgi:hypothetical protein
MNRYVFRDGLREAIFRDCGIVWKERRGTAASSDGDACIRTDEGDFLVIR